jgi:hypothetical protein
VVNPAPSAGCHTNFIHMQLNNKAQLRLPWREEARSYTHIHTPHIQYLSCISTSPVFYIHLFNMQGYIYIYIQPLNAVTLN